MKCLHCGHCCLTYAVIVIKNPTISPRETPENTLLLDGTKKCPHLIGSKPGKYHCKIHHYKWFKNTPCGTHAQYETSNTPCRLGEYILNHRLSS